MASYNRIRGFVDRQVCVMSGTVSSRVKLAKRVLVQSIVFLVGMAIADLMLWVFLPVPLERPHAVTRKLKQNLPGLKKEIEYTRNAFGFRSVSMKRKEKAPGTIRIICMGASTTDQSMQNTEDIWSSILEKSLNEAFKSTGFRIETAAYGHGGTRTAELLYWAEPKLLEFEPDLVITLVGINDLCLNGYPGYSYSSLGERLEEIAQKESEDESDLWHRCRAISQVCRRLDMAERNLEIWWKIFSGRTLQWHSKNVPNFRRRYRQLPHVDVPRRETDPMREFSDSIAGLLEFLKKSDIDVIVLGQPVLWTDSLKPQEADALWFSVASSDGAVRPSLSWLEQEMRRYNDEQRRQAELLGADYVDMDRCIPKSLEYFFDDCHFTDMGNQKVASAILPSAKQRVQQIINRRRTRQ